MRLTSNLSIDQAADLLQVTPRTIRNWERGDSRVPYSAYKLVRLLGNGELLPAAWEGWSVRDNCLYSPTGQSFLQHELLYISNYFVMARYWQADYPRRNRAIRAEKLRAQKPVLRLVKAVNS